MKDFDDWNLRKQNIEKTKNDTLPFHEREIWWCSIGINLGDEQDGKNELYERPVLVIKKFNNKVAWVLPMSTKQKDGIYYFSILHEGKVFTVILSQLRLVSIKRFHRFIRKITPSQFEEIQDRLIGLIKRPG